MVWGRGYNPHFGKKTKTFHVVFFNVTVFTLAPGSTGQVFKATVQLNSTTGPSKVCVQRVLTTTKNVRKVGALIFRADSLSSSDVSTHSLCHVLLKYSILPCNFASHISATFQPHLNSVKCNSRVIHMSTKSQSHFSNMTATGQLHLSHLKDTWQLNVGKISQPHANI